MTTRRCRLTLGADIRAWTHATFDADSQDEAIALAHTKAQELILSPASLDWTIDETYEIQGDEAIMLDRDNDGMIEEILPQDLGVSPIRLQDFARKVAQTTHISNPPRLTLGDLGREAKELTVEQ